MGRGGAATGVAAAESAARRAVPSLTTWLIMPVLRADRVRWPLYLQDLG